MSLRIVDADIVALRIAKSSKRVSEQIRVLMEAITDLKPDQAKRIVLEEGERPSTARSALRKAIKASGVGLRIATSSEGDIVFALSEDEVRNRKRLGTSARKKMVREIARDLITKRETVTTGDVIEAFADAGVSLDDVSRPGTMVGAVISNMDDFERVSTGVYRKKS